MKVGILTFQWASNRNFGASLQSYACLKLMKKIFGNSNVELINYNPTNLGIIGKFLYILTGYKFQQYNKNFLKLGKEVKTIEELKKTNQRYDAYIVGSDQVWRGKWITPKKMAYFLNFVDENKLKISYAASFGVDYWDGGKDKLPEVQRLINKFDYISVREKSGITICKEVFGKDAEWVLDPTLMLKREEYEDIIEECKEIKKRSRYISYMLLDDEHKIRKFSNEMSKYLNLNIKFINGKTIKLLGKKITFYNRVSEWLRDIKDSELIITDSFHCTVFALVFKKEFLVVANRKRGMARLESLLSLVGLEERFILELEVKNIKKILEKKIDYVRVEKKLDVYREKSYRFLSKILENIGEKS